MRKMDLRANIRDFPCTQILDKFVCDLCGKHITKARACKRHIIVAHTTNKPFTCDICDKKYHLECGLKEHKKTHLPPPEKSFTCDECGYACVTKSRLTAHMAIHKPPQHECDYCGKIFSRILTLQQHVSVHTGENPHSCNVCHKQFRTRKYLARHILAHNITERPHKCSLCDKAYITGSILKQHINNVHMGNRKKNPAQLCKQCGAITKNLTTHMVIHTGVKDFKCDVCDKKFSLKHHLENHLATSHGDERPFPCPKCDMAFKLAHHMRAHLARKH